MQHRQLKMEKLNEVMTLSRSGYTGEDGYEISVSNANILKFMDILMKDKEITMAGLGCRDSLRLEAGLCLHGNDIDESTNAMEGSLVWVVRKTVSIFFFFIVFKRMQIILEEKHMRKTKKHQLKEELDSWLKELV